MEGITPPVIIASPPLPWLGDAAGSPEKQAWSASGDTLVVRYPFVRRDYYRQVFAGYKRIWWLFAFMGAMVAFVLFVIYRYASTPGKASPFMFILLAIVALEIPVLTLVIAVVTERTMRDRVHQVTLSAAGICKNIEPVKRGEIQIVTPWMNVKWVSESQEDTLIMPRFGLHAAMVPHSAFADPDAAGRFRDAAVALWQTGGNMNAVPEAVRAEFAPQPNATETV